MSPAGFHREPFRRTPPAVIDAAARAILKALADKRKAQKEKAK